MDLTTFIFSEKYFLSQTNLVLVGKNKLCAFVISVVAFKILQKIHIYCQERLSTLAITAIDSFFNSTFYVEDKSIVTLDCVSRNGRLS